MVCNTLIASSNLIVASGESQKCGSLFYCKISKAFPKSLISGFTHLEIKVLVSGKQFASLGGQAGAAAVETAGGALNHRIAELLFQMINCFPDCRIREMQAVAGALDGAGLLDQFQKQGRGTGKAGLGYGEGEI